MNYDCPNLKTQLFILNKLQNYIWVYSEATFNAYCSELNIYISFVSTFVNVITAFSDLITLILQLEGNLTVKCLSLCDIHLICY